MNFPIKSIQDLENISSSAKWQFFEKLVAFIFEENGFEAKQNVIIKNESCKRQFDVIAKRFSVTYLVECKKWKSRREKSSALKSAVAKHLERCTLYESMNSGEFRPLIVTLLEENIDSHDGVLIVPTMKLNWVINNFESIENHD
ncbi:MAG: restriction endonuclease [Candidatus Aenigmarchaeota archaeon]|nr:restriction endonuclease [Candidatus Aenigmarchaeota archaeon]